MATNKPTVPINPQDVEDRTAYLRDMLQYPMTKEDLIPITREMARLMVAINSDISTLPVLRNDIVRIEKLFLNFMSEQLTYRKEREQHDLELAKEKVAKAESEVLRTNEKIKAIKLDGTTGVPYQTLQGKTNWRAWFIDRVLPYLVQSVIIGSVILVGSALWLYFKTSLGVP